MADFSILQSPDFAKAALGGYQAGRALGQQKRLDAALGSVDLSRPETIVPVLQIDPQTGTSLMTAAQGVRKTATQQRAAEVAPQAAQGNAAAINELWGLDPDLARQLNGDHIKMVDEGVKAAGQSALGLLQLPEGQRAAAWDAAIDSLDERYPGLAQFKGQYSPTNLMSVLAQAGLTKDYYDITQPRYQALVPGGTLGQTNPLAGPVYQGGTSQPEGGGQSSGGAGGAGSGVPRNVRNNNPGNIEDGPFARSQPGYLGGDGRFARFSDASAGSAAQGALLGSYMNRGFDTVEKIINRWAPRSDGNDTGSYVASVARQIGVKPGDKLSASDIPNLQRAIARVEGQPGPSSGITPRTGLNAPRAGTERTGAGGVKYRFKGGNPADKASWERVS